MKIDITSIPSTSAIFDFSDNEVATGLIDEFVSTRIHKDEARLVAMIIILKEADILAKGYKVTISNGSNPYIKLSYANKKEKVYVDVEWGLRWVSGGYYLFTHDSCRSLYASNYPDTELSFVQHFKSKGLPIADLDCMPRTSTTSIVDEMDYVVAVARKQDVKRIVDVAEKLKALGRGDYKEDE